jgi:hypothetical protein
MIGSLATLHEQAERQRLGFVQHSDPFPHIEPVARV